MVFLNKYFVKKNYNILVDEFFYVFELIDKVEFMEENNILEGIICFGGEIVKEVMIFCFDVVDFDICIFFKDVI